MITYDDFAKVELKAGKILSAVKVPETDKLLRLEVDFGETEEKIEKKEIVESDNLVVLPTTSVPSISSTSVPSVNLIPKTRQIISGISMYYSDPVELVGKVCMFVTNLEPRMIKGLESNGMILALSTPEGGFSLLEVNETIPIGTKAK